MPGTLAELYGALLKQEPQGILSAARFNPLMMAKALRQQEANPRPALASLMNYPQTWQQFGDNIQANYPIDSPAAVRQAAFEAAKNVGPLSVKGVNIPADMSYKISHRPMTDAGGASRLHDLTPSFGEDIYGKNALQYFGSGDKRESQVVDILRKLRGNPDAEVTVYRGVPKDAPSAINHGDWVTLHPEVAKDYGEKVISTKVKASDITSWPDSLLEFGYFPSGK